MNYTKNYHLPQWVETDRIQMEDFNQAMADIDEGLNEVKTMVENVQDAYTPDNMPFVIGTYTGNGAETNRDINLGFKPRFVIISGMARTGNTTNAQFSRFGFFGATGSTVTVAQITNNGFRLVNSSLQYPELNTANVVYTYIAFR